MLSSFFGPEERRRDPEDGQWRTYRELQEACKGKYSEQEIRAYWENQCKAGAPGAGPADGQPLINVVNDPFMTTAAQRREDVRTQNPFTSPIGEGEPENVQRDPFLTQAQARHRPAEGPPDRFGTGGSLAVRREQLYDEMMQARKHWTEVAAKLLGPGDTDRKTSVRNILILAPWLVFMWELLVWLLLRHYSPDSCTVLTVLLAIASCVLVVLWTFGKRFGPVSLLPLGALCLVAVVSATLLGDVGWHGYWRQYWWLQTGNRNEHNSASTPAAGMIDSAVIGFWDEAKKRTMNGTYVDYLKGAGYKDKHYYCVAPILSPTTAEGTIVRVNFWAVGMDCCQRSGSFHCDDSRRADAGYGVAMLDDGFPCPDCHEQKFKAAINKAEALHNLVSTKGAVMVRWVRSPSSTGMHMLLQAILFIVVSGFVAFFVLAFLGSVCWYYGVGKRSLFEGFDEGTRQKLLA
mmetsp:Transcript_35287/g.109934  ORF Transcript_35287/g.109934 Transcript_35287/m.109934 type:complete len:461 (+) Transcript_35287:171-1553(+)